MVSSRFGKTLENALHYRGLRYWQGVAEQARQAPLSRLRQEQDRARSLWDALNSFLPVAEDRLALPRLGSTIFPFPPDADWSWRPELWRTAIRPGGGASVLTETPVGHELMFYHDCPRAQIVYRQQRNRRDADLAPYGLSLEVFDFDGSFLSVALNLPSEAAQGLRRRHLIRLDTSIEMERPIKIFARLNVQHGPNTEQLVRELPLHEGNEVMVEFDLTYSEFDERRSDKLWLDLIFDDPAMNRIVVRDLTFSRRPRAEL